MGCREIIAGEFAGTFVFFLSGNTAVAAVLLQRSKGSGIGIHGVAVAWGVGLTLGCLTAAGVGTAPGHLNPAVSLAAAICGDLKWGDCGYCMIGQFLGAFYSALVQYLIHLPAYEQETDPKRILYSFAPGEPIGEHNFISATFVEVLGTAFLLFCINAVATTSELKSVTFIIFGLMFTAMVIAYAAPRAASLNPARDLGPRVAHALLPIPCKGGSEWSYVLPSVLGSFFGGLLGYSLWTYTLIAWNKRGIGFGITILVVLAIASFASPLYRSRNQLDDLSEIENSDTVRKNTSATEAAKMEEVV